MDVGQFQAFDRCHICDCGFKANDVCQEAYVVRETPDGLRRLYPYDTYLESVLVHRKCPSLGELMRRAAKRDYEKRTAPNEGDSIHMVQSPAAMKYVQDNFGEVRRREQA